MFTDEQVRKLITNALEGADGHTEYAQGSEPGRYVVGGAGPSLTLYQINLDLEPSRSRTIIREWADKNADAETIGFWIDRTEPAGRAGHPVVFDAGTTFHSATAANIVGMHRGEKEIYDSATGECLPVG